VTFFAIFDQHNGLKQEQRQRAPTNLLQWPQSPWTLLQLIISASENNDDQPATKDIESLFPFFEGPSPIELSAWRTKNAFFVQEPSLDELTEPTGNIPYELSRVLKCLKDFKYSVPPPTLRQVLASYRGLLDLQKAHDKYLKDHGVIEPDLNYGLIEHKCMLYMTNGKALPLDEKLVFDRQLFFLTPLSEEFRLIRPSFPLALDMVVQVR